MLICKWRCLWILYGYDRSGCWRRCMLHRYCVYVLLWIRFATNGHESDACSRPHYWREEESAWSKGLLHNPVNHPSLITSRVPARCGGGYPVTIFYSKQILFDYMFFSLTITALRNIGTTKPNNTKYTKFCSSNKHIHVYNQNLRKNYFKTYGAT